MNVRHQFPRTAGSTVQTCPSLTILTTRQRATSGQNRRVGDHHGQVTPHVGNRHAGDRACSAGIAGDRRGAEAVDHRGIAGDKAVL